jgi:hypothetical protein
MAQDEGFADDSDNVVVLGTELAAATAAQRRHVPPGPSPIAGVAYPEGSADLWRWVDRPEDGALAAFLATYVATDRPDQTVTRANLTMDDLYTLLLFAKRCALAAIRTGDQRAARQAFDALSAIDIERVDWRDVVVTAMLAGYAAPRTGLPATEAAAGAVGRAEPRVSEIIAEAAEKDDIDLAGSCGYRVVTTPDGPALFEDGLEFYQPDRDLVPVALGLAAAIEDDRTYHVDGLSIGEDLPPIWVSANTDKRIAAAIDGLTGCASIHGYPLAGPDRGAPDHFLLVYLAEAATTEDAAAIAEGATHGGRPGSVELGVAAGRLCAVLVAASTRSGEPSLEDTASLARFQPTLAALLA